MIGKNRRLALTALLMGLTGVTSTAWADKESGKARCDNATLKGTYSLAVQAAVSTGPGTFVPDAYAGFVTYDGRGNIWLRKTSAINGAWAERGSTGTYSVGNDCVGIATYPGSAIFQYFVAPDGSSLTFVKIASYIDGEFVDTPDRLSSTAFRVSKKALVQPPPG